MSLRKDVEEKVAGIDAVKLASQKAYEAMHGKDRERSEQADYEIATLRKLIEPIIKEAATEGVAIKTSLDPEIAEYFSNRIGGLRLGFAERKNTNFKPLFPIVVSDEHDIKLYHEVKGLLVILQKEIIGMRNLTLKEKLSANLKGAAKKYILGEQSVESVEDKKPELLEYYHQGISFFPGDTTQGLKPWALSPTSHVMRSFDFGQFGLYGILNPTGLLPELDPQASAEECVQVLRNQLVIFLATVERYERARKDHELTKGKKTEK
jgi:hypothetical protein